MACCASCVRGHGICLRGAGRLAGAQAGLGISTRQGLELACQGARLTLEVARGAGADATTIANLQRGVNTACAALAAFVPGGGGGGGGSGPQFGHKAPGGTGTGVRTTPAPTTATKGGGAGTALGMGALALLLLKAF